MQKRLPDVNHVDYNVRFLSYKCLKFKIQWFHILSDKVEKNWVFTKNNNVCKHSVFLNFLFQNFYFTVTVQTSHKMLEFHSTIRYWFNLIQNLFNYYCIWLNPLQAKKCDSPLKMCRCQFVWPRVSGSLKLFTMSWVN